MNGTDPDGRDGAFPIDRYPDPVMRYTVRDGVPAAEAINGAFESAFGPVSSGTPVRAVLGRARVSVSERSRDFLTRLVGEDFFTDGVETVNGRYCVRVLSPTDDTDGFVFFIDREAISGDTSEAGSDADRERLGTKSEDSEREENSRERGTEFDIDRVASVLSHDLRNPLDVAKARLRAARETGADEHFDHVERAHERMERIIEDVLTLSRGPEHIDPDGTTELRAVVESAWETVETGDATLTVKDELPTAVADGDRIERLFENLFRNAVEHGDRPTVTVGTLDGATTGIYVADTGPGIPSGDRSAIFRPGYSSRDRGTGLGLSIVKRIAESHGWTIEAKNSAGARFEIRGMESET